MTKPTNHNEKDVDDAVNLATSLGVNIHERSPDEADLPNEDILNAMATLGVKNSKYFSTHEDDDEYKNLYDSIIEKYMSTRNFEEKLNFITEEDAYKFLGYKKLRNGDYGEYNKVLNYMIEHDSKLIADTIGTKKEREELYLKYSNARHPHLQKQLCGADGKFDELFGFVVEKSWRSTTFPFGEQAFKRIEKFINNVEPPPSDDHLKYVSQRKADLKLWKDLKEGEYEHRVWRAPPVEETEYELHLRELEHRRLNRDVLIAANDFTAARDVPTLRQFEWSMKDWSKGQSKGGAHKGSFPILLTGRENMRDQKMIHESDLIKRAEDFTADHILSNNVSSEKQYAEYLLNYNYKQALRFLRKYHRDEERQRKAEADQLLANSQQQQQQSNSRDENPVMLRVPMKRLIERRGAVFGASIIESIAVARYRNVESMLYSNVKLIEDQNKHMIFNDDEDDIEEDSSSDDDEFGFDQNKNQIIGVDSNFLCLPFNLWQTSENIDQSLSLAAIRRQRRQKIVSFLRCEWLYLSHRTWAEWRHDTFCGRMLRPIYHPFRRLHKHIHSKHPYKSQIERFQEAAHNRLSRIREEVSHPDTLDYLANVRPPKMGMIEYLQYYRSRKTTLRKKIEFLETIKQPTRDEAKNLVMYRTRLDGLDKYHEKWKLENEHVRAILKGILDLIEKREGDIDKLKEPFLQRVNKFLMNAVKIQPGSIHKKVAVSHVLPEPPNPVEHDISTSSFDNRFFYGYEDKVTALLAKRARERHREQMVARMGARVGIIVGDPDMMTDGSIYKKVDRLVFAAVSGDVSKVLDLLDRDRVITDGCEAVDPNVVNEEGVTALFATLQSIVTNISLNDHEHVERLLYNPFWRHMRRLLLPKQKSMNRYDVVIQVLLYFGADLSFAYQDLYMNDGLTILHYAIKENSITVLQWLLEMGVDVCQLTTTRHISPLMLAAKYDNIEAFTLLLRYGAIISMEHADNQGNTLLHYAAKYSSTLLIRLALMCGANRNVVNHAGLSPADDANRAGNTESHSIILSFSAQVRDSTFRLDHLYAKLPSSQKLSRDVEKEETGNSRGRKRLSDVVSLFVSETQVAPENNIDNQADDRETRLEMDAKTAAKEAIHRRSIAAIDRHDSGIHLPSVMRSNINSPTDTSQLTLKNTPSASAVLVTSGKDRDGYDVPACNDDLDVDSQDLVEDDSILKQHLRKKRESIHRYSSVLRRSSITRQQPILPPILSSSSSPSTKTSTQPSSPITPILRPSVLARLPEGSADDEDSEEEEFDRSHSTIDDFGNFDLKRPVTPSTGPTSSSTRSRRALLPIRTMQQVPDHLHGSTHKAGTLRKTLLQLKYIRNQQASI